MVAQSQTKDHYHTLGIQHDASADDIKAAFRKLARQFHPDLSPNPAFAEEHFKQINEAYETLRDPQKRARYDFTRPTLSGANAASLLSRGRRARSVMAEDALREVERFRKDARGPFWQSGTEPPKNSENTRPTQLSEDEATRVVNLALQQGFSAVTDPQGAVVFMPVRHDVDGISHIYFRPQRVRTLMDAISVLLAPNVASG